MIRPEDIKMTATMNLTEERNEGRERKKIRKSTKNLQKITNAMTIIIRIGTMVTSVSLVENLERMTAMAAMNVESGGTEVEKEAEIGGMTESIVKIDEGVATEARIASETGLVFMSFSITDCSIEISADHPTPSRRQQQTE